MKRFILLSTLFLFFLLSVKETPVRAQTTPLTDNHTAREEAEGKKIWEKLQVKQFECQNLTDDHYGSLGEYFMGQMMGDSHEAMNNRLIRMLGEEDEEQMHIAMGKRMSGCEPNASMPQNMMGGGMMSMMMNMMGGGGNLAPALSGVEGMGYGGWNNMMGGWSGFGVLGWVQMIVFWILLILGVIALFRYLGGSGKKNDEGKSPLDILKERYAKGEIDRKEFEQMKKELA